MGKRRSESDVRKAKRMGLRGVLAESVYVNLDSEGEWLDEESPRLLPWRETIVPFSRWAGRSLRNDLMYITTSGTLYYNQQSRRIQFLEPRELSMVEKRENDPNDVADIFVGDKVEGRIPCLKDTRIHFSTLPEYKELDLAMFQELYPDYWQGLHPDIQRYIEDNGFNCEVHVNPDTCELIEDDQGCIRGLYTLHVPLHSLTKAYWTMNLSAEEGNKYTQKDRTQFLVGFTGARDAQDVPERTGFFVIKIPPRGSGQRITIIFMSMLALRLMLMSYYVWMTDGSLERKAYRYGLEMPREAYGIKEWEKRNQAASEAAAQPTESETEDEASGSASDQVPMPDDGGADGEEDADGVPRRPRRDMRAAETEDDAELVEGQILACHSDDAPQIT